MRDDAERNFPRQCDAEEYVKILETGDTRGCAEFPAWRVQEDISPAVEGVQCGERRFEPAAIVAAEDFVTGAPVEGLNSRAEFEIVIFRLVTIGETVVRIIGLPGEFRAIIECHFFVDGDRAVQE